MSRMIKGRLAGLAAAATVIAGLGAAPAFAGHHELGQVLEARSDKDKARDKFRNPKETLEFFGVTHTSRVVEALPGGGWYTRILLPLVAENGLYAANNYQGAMFKQMNPDMSDERLARFNTFGETFPTRAQEWVDGEPAIAAWNFGDAPEELKGTMDHVLFVRALHNLNRAGGDWINDALKEAFDLLKPGGVMGVVQHRAPEDAADDWANGSNGYLKQSYVIKAAEAAGFKLEASSEINANPKDKPTADDYVWRLPPSLNEKDEAKKKANMEIGESDRMTLKFVKPAE